MDTRSYGVDFLFTIYCSVAAFKCIPDRGERGSDRSIPAAFHSLTHHIYFSSLACTPSQGEAKWLAQQCSVLGVPVLRLKLKLDNPGQATPLTSSSPATASHGGGTKTFYHQGN